MSNRSFDERTNTSVKFTTEYVNMTFMVNLGGCRTFFQCNVGGEEEVQAETSNCQPNGRQSNRYDIFSVGRAHIGHLR